MYVPGVSAPEWLRRQFSEPRTTSLPYNNALVLGVSWWCGVNRVDSLLTPFIRELGIEDGVRFAEIKRNWHNLFDKPLSYHMSPSMLSGDEIVLNVDSPVWLQELNFYKEDIIKKLSVYGVKAVRFRLGRVSMKTTSDNRRKKSRTRTLATEEISYVENTVSQICDEKLKGAIQKAMTKSLIAG